MINGVAVVLSKGTDVKTWISRHEREIGPGLRGGTVPGTTIPWIAAIAAAATVAGLWVFVQLRPAGRLAFRSAVAASGQSDGWADNDDGHESEFTS